ncbi:hypothetical protein AK812_SmicGene35 [Symbiodinium microadriaticum]|uniref:RING-type domain-containing protein n=1 Tax=Symbiodinium microadriaticum TaxID=2951 RepID=A0A1Q9F7K1_SYMMI|nr:hypothetical protein AK812_SmicGene35 [Symbiodinium microadriaticum]
MAASVQCSNAKLVAWGLVLVLLSVLSMLVGVVKGAHWPMAICASVSVLLFLLLFVVVFTKTTDAQARTDPADAMEMQKEHHCVWAACKFGELEATCTSPIFSLLLVKNDPGGPSDSSDLDTNIVTWTTLTTVGHRLTGVISRQRACACCLEDYHMDSDVALLPCGHIYHQDAVAAGARIGSIFKEPTITPTKEQLRSQLLNLCRLIWPTMAHPIITPSKE